MKNFIIAYDIADKISLPKVRKIAYSYALGGQKSAVEAPLNLKLMKSLVQELDKIIKKDDKINIISVTKNPILLGKAKQTLFENNGIIIV